jgi:lysophospholipase L1-like esterase
VKNFYFFGDSVTLGVNDIAAGGWTARFAGKAAQAGLHTLPDTFYNLGVRKNSSRMIMERWEQEFRVRVIDGVPAYLLFCFGTVDMAAPRGLPNIPMGESAANAGDILKKAGMFGKLLMMSAPPVKDEEHNQRLEALCTAYASVCRDLKVPFLDCYHPLRDSDYMLDLSDGVHPGAMGNEILAELMVQSDIVRAWMA